MSKEIILTNGAPVLVDDDDFEALSAFSWSLHNGYASRRYRDGDVQRRAYMHIQITGTKNCDHKNLNRLDNRKENLRPSNQSQNSANSSKRSKNSSGAKGVSLCKQTGKWRASIQVNGKCKNLGRYSSVKEAAEAYVKAAEEHFKEFARYD